MTRPTVIHVRDMQPGDVYIGRKMVGYPQPSPWLANYNKIGGGMTRQAAIDNYADDLDAKLAGPDGEAVRVFLRSLTGKRLACWCAPKACHGDVIAGMVERLVKEVADAR